MNKVFVLLCALFVVLAAAVSSAQEVRVGGKRTLVLLDNNNIQKSHSQFFDSLKARGFQLDFKLASSSGNQLQQYGEFLYDNLIIMAPESEFKGAINENSIIDFIDNGHNVFIATGNVLSETLRSVALECGVEFDDDETYVIDHFNYDTNLDGGQHNTIVVDNFFKAPTIYNGSKRPVLFRGLGIDFTRDSKLLIPVLSGYPTTYSHSTEEAVSSDPHVAGTDTVLVAGLQARNGARATFVGSMDALSNNFFDAAINKYNPNGNAATFDKSGNREFAEELTKWAFQERGVLRHRNVYHHKVNETEMLPVYKIKEDIEYSVIIEEWQASADGGKWVPYVANDIQMEFIMLDPYIRTDLKHEGGGLYKIAFTTPDVYGVFQFKVDYRRPGLSLLTFTDQVSVRPLRLNEYERFIASAYPYYAGAFSMMIGFFIFGFFFLYNRG
eukprot:GEZU01042190.1.p1 GENE.GEZU01042190.1~~GEZU01042190.1.p1  ORF type:complete len:448 (+),score=162.97 GEZU01042190.1:23-1345(+)